jgi:hypothetical protein
VYSCGVYLKNYSNIGISFTQKIKTQKLKSHLIIIVLTIIQTLPAYSQTEEAIARRIHRVNSHYEQSNVANILSGKTYNIKYRYSINSQFYDDSYPSNGSLVYDGVFFPSIEIQYDLFIQQVIVLHKTKNASRYISIDTDKVSKFSINESKFTRIADDSIMDNGIYELAFSGAASKVLVKRLKNRKEKVVEGKNVLVFSEENIYFLQNEFGTFHIYNKKSLFKAYKNSEIMRKLVKKNKIKISKNNLEIGVVTAVSLFELSK